MQAVFADLPILSRNDKFIMYVTYSSKEHSLFYNTVASQYRSSFYESYTSRIKIIGRDVTRFAMDIFTEQSYRY